MGRGYSCGGRIKAVSFLPGERDRHYGDHEYEFEEYITAEEYEELARVFFDKLAARDIQWFEDVEGVLYKYDKRKREFGMCRSDGFIITYFRPATGMKYWGEQVVEHDVQKMCVLWR